MNRNSFNKIVDKSEDFPEGEPFELTEYVIGITRKDWICGTDFYDRIQMVAVFEIVDLDECGCLEDDNDGEYPITVQASILVHPKFFCQKYIDGFFEKENLVDGKYSPYWALSDAYSYGGGIPINMENVSSAAKCDVLSSDDYGSRRFKNSGDAEKYIKEVYCNNITATMGLIGFTLDRPINMIGTTGWDIVRNMTEGMDWIKPALDRHRG
jgi:hypothetical protein